MVAANYIRALACALSLCSLGCQGQTSSKQAPTGTLSPELARRIEVLIRSKSKIPPDYTVQVSPRSASDVPGYDQLSVTFQADGQTSKPSNFLISADNKTLAQFSRFDISKDPKELVSSAGRPARGGPEGAPVEIVVFDDLECPYCARMHSQLFPALTARYKDSVHVVYRDFPLDQHPWAMRAAVDTGCIGAQSAPGYWNVVDYIHAHAAELGGTEHSLAKADDEIDRLTRDEGKKQNVKPDLLAACILKQDVTAVNASRKEAEALGVDSTPALFINGERLEGAIPIEYVYRVVDGALSAAGKTPPPPVPSPPMQGAPKAGS